MGDFDKVQHFAETYRLELLDTHARREVRNKPQFTGLYDIGIAEIVLMPTSGLINRTIGESGFRDKYHVNILGIRRKREYILNNLKDEKMHSGDVLLVQRQLECHRPFEPGKNSDWVVLGQPLNEAAKVTLDYKAPLAGVIMLLMIMAMVFDFIPIAPVTAIMIAAVLMVLTGCFRNVEAAYKTINWESIVLIAAMLPMSMALEKTGVSEYISNSLVSGLGVYGPIAPVGRHLFSPHLY